MPSVLGTNRHVVCKRSKPPPRTADATCIAINEQSQDRYLCKDQTSADWLPMVEWIAQDLARRCGLLIPDCFVVELEADPGVYMFGSKWEGGAEQYAPDIVGKVTNPDEFSAIHAFDLLIHNVDRHLNNYLYLQLAGDTVVKAVDHSRCLCFSGWPLPPPPPDLSSNTMRAFGVWSADAAWKKAVAEQVIDKWRLVKKSELQDTLDSLPPAWVLPNRRTDLLDWWESADWDARTTNVLGALP
ncbi:hypothetical protein ACS5PK_22245 [Roseateles sp. DB2]|uniref:hypothetical protein n=1 Tax=Roseateles sp. DB2 TaxID=3453717 RepID=UPI003EE92F2D